MEQVIYQDLNRIDYQAAWDYQTQIHKAIVQRKLAIRNDGSAEPPLPHQLLFCEHSPVYTLGKSGSLDNLLLNERELADQGFTFYKINRGGDITYHGPGQLVGYPIFDLERFFTDVHKYVRFIEEAIIRTLDSYGLEGIRIKGYTGVWLDERGSLPKRKICAIGVHLSRWVTMHGFAFNLNTDLSHFDHIIPCGIVDKDKDVTSLAKEIGKPVDMEEVKAEVKKHFAELFEYEYLEA
jgi:lipoyl(octanoyl) transferase